MAAARAFAMADGGQLHDCAPAGVGPSLPVPHRNVLNGGAHAATPLAFQGRWPPWARRACGRPLGAAAEVYGALRRRLQEAGLATGLGDEGGFAADVSRPEDALYLLVAAIGDAGYRAGDDIFCTSSTTIVAAIEAGWATPPLSSSNRSAT